MSESGLAITMHSLIPHPFRHPGRTGYLVDGLEGHHVQALWLNQTHLPWPFLNTKRSKMPFLCPFCIFLLVTSYFPSKPGSPWGCLQRSCCLFFAAFYCSFTHGPLSRSKRHSEISSSKGLHEAVEDRQGFLVCPDKSPIWVVSVFLPREPGLPIQAYFSL